MVEKMHSCPRRYVGHEIYQLSDEEALMKKMNVKPYQNNL